MLPDHIYHVYNRGINRETLFYTERNYIFFRQKIERYICSCADVIGYSLMPNHFHLMVYVSTRSLETPFCTPTRPEPLQKLSRISFGLQQMLSGYAKAINKQQSRTGSLFTQNTPRKLTSGDGIGDDYAFWCLNYLHMNPVAAGLTDHPAKWKYSSYNEYFRGVDGICNVELGRRLCRLDLNELAY